MSNETNKSDGLKLPKALVDAGYRLVDEGEKAEGTYVDVTFPEGSPLNTASGIIEVHSASEIASTVQLAALGGATRVRIAMVRSTLIVKDEPSSQAKDEQTLAALDVSRMARA